MLISSTILLFSCEKGLRKKYSSRQECFDGVKSSTYDDIVKIWGEPDDKGKVWFNSEGVAEIDCMWKRDKVDIDGTPCIRINFSVIHYSWGEFGALQPINFYGNGNSDCD